MSRPVSRAAIVAAILRKDLQEFSRNRFIMLISILGLVVLVAVFWIMPSSVDETLVLGIHQKDMDQVLDAYAGAEGLAFVEFASTDDLKAAVTGDLDVWKTGDGTFVFGGEKPDGADRVSVQIGVDFPADFAADTAEGLKTTVVIYSDSEAAAAVRAAMTSFVRELAYGLRGDELPVTLPAETVVVLGEDRAGAQVSMRDQFRALFAFFVLMLETLSLAVLISNEVGQRTVIAILATPARLGDVLGAKTAYGALMAAGQGVIILAAMGAFTLTNWPLLLLTMILGGVMFAGVAMITGAASKDFIGTLLYTMLLIVPLAIPAVAIIFPGSSSWLVKVLPTYGLVEVLHRVTAYGESWDDVAIYFIPLLAWLVVIYLLGRFTLKRKVASL